MSKNRNQFRNSQNVLRHMRLQRGLAFGVIIITALFAFEVFNYSTTDYALTDLLGDLKFMGLRWATILSIAFCGIDFAGIARLFTPEEGSNEPNEVWYLFGAWLLAATMNAMLTWWGVSLAILSHETLGNAVIEREMLLRIVPIFVAVLVWLIRVLIIGTFSVAGDRLFSQADQRLFGQSRRIPRSASSVAPLRSMANQPQSMRASTPISNKFSPAPKPQHRPNTSHVRAEPTYHPLSMSAPANSAKAYHSGSNPSLTRSGLTRQ